jgi:hypothetical protein
MSAKSDSATALSPGLRRVPDLPDWSGKCWQGGIVQFVDAGTPRDHVDLEGLRERGVACPQWHCRAWMHASVVEPGPDGEDLTVGAWNRCRTRALRKDRSTRRWPA